MSKSNTYEQIVTDLLTIPLDSDEYGAAISQLLADSNFKGAQIELVSALVAISNMLADGRIILTVSHPPEVPEQVLGPKPENASDG